MCEREIWLSVVQFYHQCGVSSTEPRPPRPPTEQKSQSEYCFVFLFVCVCACARASHTRHLTVIPMTWQGHTSDLTESYQWLNSHTSDLTVIPVTLQSYQWLNRIIPVTLQSNQWLNSHTSDLVLGTLVAILPGTWQYKAGTGRPSVSILWQGEISWICNFFPSVAACTIVRADPLLEH